MSRKAFLPFRRAAAMPTPKHTAVSRRGLASFPPVATVAPPLPPRSGKESEEPEVQWRFFNFKQDPFLEAPEEGFFYTNAAIRQTYRELIDALAERPGIAVLTGEAGIGKTILLRRLCSELRSSGHLVIGRRAGLVFDELIAVVAEELKIPGSGED